MDFKLFLPGDYLVSLPGSFKATLFLLLILLIQLLSFFEMLGLATILAIMGTFFIFLNGVHNGAFRSFLLSVCFLLYSAYFINFEYKRKSFGIVVIDRALSEEPEYFQGLVLEDDAGFKPGMITFKLRGKFDFVQEKVNLFVRVPDLPWRPEANIRSGDKVECFLSLSAINASNIFEKLFFLQGGYASRAEIPRLDEKNFYCKKLISKHDSASENLSGRINDIAEKLYDDIAFRDGTSRTGLGVFIAATGGRPSHLSPWIRELFISTGLYHLLVVSGYHVGVLAGIIVFIINLFIRIFPSILGRFSRSNILFIFSILLLICFIGLGKVRPPIVRAVIMFVVGSLARVFERDFHMITSIIYSLIVISVIWPLCILLPGVQLSYAALVGVIFGLKVKKRINKNYFGKFGSRGKFYDKYVENFSSIFFVTLGASLSVLPVQLYWFSEWSPYAVFFNVIFAPLFSIMVIGGGIILLFLYSVFPFAARPLLIIHSQLTESLVIVIEWIYELIN
ncbi:MAG TPA: ComEC/Rec2 family competence protein [Oligoflexia bacterium]|nr:ComEC/Rec2 family competence protein [Oligoflexia bacterium]HMP48882.1 ComEC/Rec2 family competence protein [Oligoflexia bacterium]